MRTFLKQTLYLAMLIAATAYSSQALADKGGKGRGKHHEYEDDDHHKGRGRHHSDEDEDHHGKRHGKRGRHQDDDKIAVFLDSDRIVIREYLRKHHGYSCPPGLAKKRNGCLPPGQAKKLYRVGYPLEADWYDVPDSLLGHLHPVPAGYRYVIVDKDVVLIGEATKKVIDAVTLFSAVE